VAFSQVAVWLSLSPPSSLLVTSASVSNSVACVNGWVTLSLILYITRWLTAGPAGDSQALKQAPLDYTDIDPVDVTNDRTLPDVLVIAASNVTLEPDPTPHLADPSEDSLHPTIPECMC
jgi:hypothetical protein